MKKLAASIIALIKDKEKIVGYRLLDIDKTIYIERKQLYELMQTNKIKIDNAKLYGKAIVGSKYKLELLPEAGKDIDKLLVVKVLNSESMLVSNSLGQTKVIGLEQFCMKSIREKIINIDYIKDFEIKLRLRHGFVLDTAEYKNMKVFDTYLINKATNKDSIETLIINDNIQSMQGTFIDLDKITRVVISKNVKHIDNTIFMNTKIMNTTFYVSFGSIAHEMCLYFGFIFKLIDKVSDYTEMTTPEPVQSKFRMMLSGTEYDTLLTDRNILNIEYTYKLIKNTNNMCKCNLQLNTSKFKHIKETYGLNDFRKEIESKHGKAEFSSEITSAFISLCNFITTVFDNNNTLYEDTYIKNASISLMNIKTIYYDGKSSIQVIDVYYDHIKTILKLLVIVIDNDIVFQTICDRETQDDTREQRLAKNILRLSTGDMFDSTFGKLFDTNVMCKDITIGSQLCIGDTIYMTPNIFDNSKRLCIHDIDLPITSDIEKLYEDFKRNFVLIGTNIETEDSIEKKLAKTLFLELTSCRFIECLTDIESEVGYNTYKIVKLKVIKTYELSEMSRIDKVYFRWVNIVKTASKEKISNGTLVRMKGIEKTKSGESIVKAADLVFRNIDTIKNGILPLDIFNAISRTDLIVKRNKIAMNSINIFKQISDIKYRTDDENIEIIDTSTNYKYNKKDARLIVVSNREKYSYYISTFTLDKLIDILYRIGEYRTNNKNLDTIKVQEDPVHSDLFITVATVKDIESNNINDMTDDRCVLALSKTTGDTYFVLRASKHDTIAFLRFASFLDGYYYLIANKTTVSNTLKEHSLRRASSMLALGYNIYEREG